MEKKKKILRAAGIIMIILGAGVLSFYGYRKISRELSLRKLLNNNINFEIFKVLAVHNNLVDCFFELCFP